MIRRAVILVAFVIVGLTGCQDPKPPAADPWDANRILGGGPYALRRLQDKDEIHGSISGSMFLLIGSLSGELSTEWVARFSFQGNDGNFWFATISVRKLRVKFADIPQPTITFHLRQQPYRCMDSSLLSLDCMDSTVEYAVLAIREQDYPRNVNMPLGAK